MSSTAVCRWRRERGSVCARRSSSWDTSPTCRRAICGVAGLAAAAARSYTALLDHTNGDWASEALIAQGLRPHLIDGVILSPLALEMSDIQPERSAVPMVLLGERLFGAPCDHVVVDNVAA